jgi:uncharacterized membrane protein
MRILITITMTLFWHTVYTVLMLLMLVTGILTWTRGSSETTPTTN